MKRLLISLFLISSFFVVWGQTEVQVTPKLDYDTNYVESYTHLLSLRLVGIQKAHEINIKDKYNDRSLMYRPNTNFSTGIGFNYKWMGLNVAFPLGFMNNDEDLYGETDQFDIQMNAYGRKMGVDAFVQRYKGYYIHNIADIHPNWIDGEPFPQREGLASIAFGLEYYYSFNDKKYSFRSSFIQNERQKKSAGSWLLGGYLNSFMIRVPLGLLPPPIIDLFDKRVNLTEVNVSNLGLSGGYIHTFVFAKHFFTTLSLDLGIAAQAAKITNKQNEDLRVGGVSGRVKFRLAAGYNTEKWNAGVTVVSMAQNFVVNQNAEISRTVGNLKFFVGRRFSVKKRK